jgi:hypothetical protein
MVGDGPSFQSLSRTRGGMTPTTVTSIQLRTDDASAARATRSVNETHATEIHQEAEDDAMSSPTFLKSFDEGWPLLRNHAGRVRTQESDARSM